MLGDRAGQRFSNGMPGGPAAARISASQASPAGPAPARVYHRLLLGAKFRSGVQFWSSEVAKSGACLSVPLARMAML